MARENTVCSTRLKAKIHGKESPPKPLTKRQSTGEPQTTNAEVRIPADRAANSWEPVQLHLGLGVGRTEVLNLPRSVTVLPHDLNRRRPRRGPNRPHIRHETTLAHPRLVRNSPAPTQRTA